MGENSIAMILYSEYGIGKITNESMNEVKKIISYYEKRIYNINRSEEIYQGIESLLGIKNAMLILRYNGANKYNPKSKTKEGKKYKRKGISTEIGVLTEENQIPRVRKLSFYDPSEEDAKEEKVLYSWNTQLFDIKGKTGFTGPFISAILYLDIPLPKIYPDKKEMEILKTTMPEEISDIENGWKEIIISIMDDLNYHIDYGKMYEVLTFPLNQTAMEFQDTQKNIFDKFLNGEKSVGEILGVLQEKNKIAKYYVDSSLPEI